jgi:hypothetical protein
VLFRTPEDDGASELRDRVRLMSFLGEASGTTRALLTRVARAAVTDEPVRLSDVADDLDLEIDVLNAAIKELNNFALGPGRVLVQVRMETAVGITGNTGKVAYLSMRPSMARLVRELTKGRVAPGE